MTGRTRVCGIRWAAAACLLLALGGCASYVASMREVDRALAAHDPQAALLALEPMAGGGDQTLYLLDKAMLLRLTGDYAGSAAVFERAKRRMTYLEATSVTETAAALTVGENLRSYRGALYERLLVHVYESLDYLQAGDADAARVEVAQIDELLKRLYPGADAAPHGGDAFARYFAGLVYEDAGRWSDALIEYRKAYQAYRAAGVADAAIPRGLQISLCRFTDYLGLDQERDDYRHRFGINAWPPVAPAGGGDPAGALVFVFSNGLAPRKVAATSIVQGPHNGVFYSVSLPVLQRRVPLAASAAIQIAGQSTATLPVADIAADAGRALAAQLPALTASEIARNVARHAVARAANGKQQGVGSLLSFIGSIVDRADTRIWNTLPDNIQLARLRLPPGRYTLTATFRDGAGAILGSKTVDDVVVKAGRITFATGRWISF